MKTLIILALLFVFGTQAEAQFQKMESDSVLATTTWTALAKPTVGQTATKRINRFEILHDGTGTANIYVALQPSTTDWDTTSGDYFILKAGEARFFDDMNPWQIWYKASAGTVPMRYLLF